jgi:hypothetical protein
MVAVLFKYPQDPLPGEQMIHEGVWRNAKDTGLKD